ncbi:MAG: N-acetylmuramoyl-L-alanine amidase [Bacteroidia bacterium]|nr:N-acetylmuramoyl-L-alanine amidase [Bacteroidia bacterium]
MYRNFQDTFFILRNHIIILAILFLNASFLSNLYAQNEKGYKLQTIVIDAGHGGKDPGAVYKSGKKILGKEKDITLSVALKVGDYIKQYYKEIKVIYTRDQDEFIELHRRASTANKNKADLFISIHANANKKKDPFGSETYVMGIHKTQGNIEVAMAENSVVLKEKDYTREYEGVDPNSPEAYILFNMLQNVYIEQSLKFAAKVQDEYKNSLQREDRGVKQAVFFVLWKTVMPSVLTEVGFLSNKEEAEYLLSTGGQEQIAYGIFNAFRSYKNELEGIKDDGIKIEKPKYEPEKKNTSLTENNENSNDTNSVSKNENIRETKPDSLMNRQNTDESGIIFKIQITSSSTKIPLNSEIFKGLKVEEREVDGAFKYMVCRSRSYREIENLQKLIRNDFPDSFIIAFKNGKKISTSDAKKEIKN